MGQRKDQVTPGDIRKDIKKARSSLGLHLRTLGHFPNDNPGDTTMAKKKPTTKSAKSVKAESKKPATKSAKSVKAESNSASRSRGNKKSRATRNGVAAKAGRVLDTLTAGAVEGAVKGAAQTLDQKKGLKGKAKSTRDVLGEMAPGAAVGAATGAAKAVMSKSGKSRSKASKGAKR